MLEFPEHGVIQLVNCISCITEVGGNLDQFCGALLQSSSKILFPPFPLNLHSSRSTRIITILLYHLLWYVRCYLQHRPWSLFFLAQEAEGKNCFPAEQMRPDFLCLGFATVCSPGIKTPLQRLVIRATSLFSLVKCRYTIFYFMTFFERYAVL